MHNNNYTDTKVKDFKSTVKKLVKYAESFKKLILIAVILATFGAILSLIGPNKLKEITNLIAEGILTGIDLTTVKNIAITLIVIYALSFIFNYVQGFIMADVTQKFSKSLRTNISKKINKLPLKYFDSTTFGNILSRVTNDVDTIAQSLNQSLGVIISAVVLLIGSIIMMFYTNWIMAITAIVSSLLGFSLMGTILKRSQKYFAMQQKELGKLNGHIEEAYAGHNVIKVYNAGEQSTNAFEEINKNLFESGKKSQFLSGLMMPIMSFVGNFGYLSVCIVGAVLVINNTIDIGTIIAFTIYVRLFSQPLSSLAQAMASFQATIAASERVFEFLEEEELSDESKISKKLTIEQAQGNIEFENVKFSYNKDKEIIKNFSAKIKRGDKVAIVGPTGAGKTTMVNLLMKFYEIDNGDIKIDGISINELSRDNIHDLFCMVLQDTWVFNGTIRENIVYNQKGISDEAIEEACKMVGLTHFINTLPDGYDTILSDIDSLSAGEKQLLTIARGSLEKAPFLILDEATSSVDTRTEELVSRAIDKLMKNRTSFIIAHRLSTIKNADLILVMREGNIVEQGNHEELLNKNGFYAELYNSQFKKVTS